LLAPECLEKRVKVMEKNRELDFLAFLTQIFSAVPGDGLFLWNSFTGEDDLDRFLRRDPPWQTSGPLWRRASLAAIGSWDEHALSAQDWEFHIRAIIAGLKYLKVSEIDSFWRMTRPTSLTHSWGAPRRVLNRIRLYQKIISMLRSQKMLTKRRQSILAAEFYEHAFVINHSRRLAYKIWAIARREKIVDAFKFTAVLTSDLLFRFFRRLHEAVATRLLPETRLKRTLFTTLPSNKHE
jgi:hypothetical protein